MSAGRLGGVVAALLIAVGCSWSRPEAPAPDRWVSLSPALTETAAHLGALDALVGRSDWCTIPPEVKRLPAFGSALTPELERLAAARPSGILVDGSVGARTDMLGAVAPVTVLPWLTVGDVVASTRRLGALLDRVETAEALADRLAQTLVVEPPTEGAEVLLALAGEGLDGGEVWFIKRNSLHGAVLHAAGGRNAVDRDVEGTPVLSLEQVVALDPDTVVVLSVSPVDAEARARIVADWSQLETLTAVKEGRVGALGGPSVLSPGPSVLDTVDLLRAELDRLDAR